MHFPSTTLNLLALAAISSATNPANKMPQAPSSNIAVECTCNNGNSTKPDSASFYLSRNITLSAQGYPYNSNPLCSTPDQGGPKICITDLGDSLTVRKDGGEEKNVKKQSWGRKDGVDCHAWVRWFLILATTKSTNSKTGIKIFMSLPRHRNNLGRCTTQDLPICPQRQELHIWSGKATSWCRAGHYWGCSWDCKLGGWV